jgi:lipopolysaccharide export system permease protein
MKLLDRLIMRELLGPFIFGVAAFASIFFAGGELVKIINEIVKGLPVNAAVELLALHFPAILALVMPMGVLLGALLAVGRLSGESEVIALYAGGISLYRIVTGVLALGVAVSALTFVLNENLSPVCNKRAAEISARLLKEDTAMAKPIPFADIKDGVTNSIVYVQNGIDPVTHALRGVLVVGFRGNEPAVVFRAATARYEGGSHGDYTWRLFDGYYESLNPWRGKPGEQGLVQTLKFTSSGYTVKLPRSPQEIEGYQRKPDEMNFSELMRHIRKLTEVGASTTEEEVNLYNKLALPFSAFVFALLACSLGVRSHRGGSSVGLGLSVLIIFIYWIVWRFASALAMQGTLHPLLGSFGASLLALIAGMVLLAKAAR